MGEEKLLVEGQRIAVAHSGNEIANPLLQRIALGIGLDMVTGSLQEILVKVGDNLLGLIQLVP